jgi:hypothetical protein
MVTALRQHPTPVHWARRLLQTRGGKASELATRSREDHRDRLGASPHAGRRRDDRYW